MVNWYYVVGSERVGPVDEQSLKQLFLKDEINLDSYVWKKGFQNWERLKDVSELRFDLDDSANEIKELVVEEIKIPKTNLLNNEQEHESEIEIKEENSPEINFNFSWSKVKDNDDIFYVRIGKDRKNYDGSDIFGPYTKIELKDGINESRMNFQTLIYSPGMSSWTKIQDTPLNENFNGIVQSVGLKEIPLLMVFNHSPLPLVTVVKKAGTKEGVLLGSGPFLDFKNQTVSATLYVGTEVKVKNVQVKIQNYNIKEQTLDCLFTDLDHNAKKIMLNHAV